MVGRKKIKVSKNRKRYWKKFCDVEDVKNHLQEEIKDEILGGSARNKTNSQLFFVDNQVKTEETKRLNWKNKGLKCHQILSSFSQISPPIKPNVRKIKKKRLTNENGKKKKIIETSKFQPKSPLKNQSFDLWETAEPSLSNGLLDEEMENYYKVQTKKKGRNVPPLYYAKPSPLCAVEVCRGGASYNPSYEDHQKLLSDALQVEQDKIKEEQRLARALDHKFPSIDQAPTQESWLKEMSQGILEEEVEGDEEEEVDCTAPLTLNPPVRADKRKPANKRRKERTQRKAAKKAELEKKEVVRANEVYRIKSLINEVMEEKYESQMRQLKRKLKKQSRNSLPAKLSRYKYEAPEIELTLSSELTGSLRTLKVEGSVLHDRFKSFQRRNIIESRIKQKKPKRKRPLKTYMKRGFEDV